METVILNNLGLIAGIFIAIGFVATIVSTLRDFLYPKKSDKNGNSGPDPAKKIKTTLLTVWILVLVSVIILAIYAGYIEDKMMTLNDLRSLDLSSAIEQLRFMGLSESIEYSQRDSTTESYTVLNQDPSPGSSVRKGSIVTLIVIPTSKPTASTKPSHPEETQYTTAPTEETQVPTAEPNPVKKSVFLTMDLSDLSDAERETLPIWNQKKYLRTDVREIHFHSSLTNVPSDAWDVSRDGNDAIVAWMDNNTLNIASDGIIQLNPNSSWLFFGFENAHTIDFGNCVDTSLVNRMEYMFSACKKLEGLDFSRFDTSNVENMGHMFSVCHRLSSLDLSGFNTSRVENMACMFYKCINLTDLDMTGWDTSNVKTMDKIFAYCDSIETIQVNHFNTRNVINMTGMFYHCKKLTHVDVSNFDTSKVTLLNSMFYHCSSLKTVDVSNFNTSRVIGMSFMFNGCTALETPDVSHFDTTNVKSYTDFMDNGREINGEPWEKFFR